MKVLLDNGRTQVELEVENGTATFLEIVARALKAMNYTEVDLLREFSTKKED